MKFIIVSTFQKESDNEPIGKYLYVGEGEKMEYICKIEDENLFSEDILYNATYINSFIKEALEKHLSTI